MRNAKNKTKSTVKKAVKNEAKDHLENDFENSDTLILNFGGKKVVLDKERQKELLEFVMALSEECEPLKKKIIDIILKDYVINNIKIFVHSAHKLEVTRMAVKIIDMKREESGLCKR